MLFYKEIVPLDKNNHAALRVAPVTDFGFARDTVVIPLAAIEFAHAAREYPIAFVRDEHGAVSSVAVVGLREGENLFIDDKGLWKGAYLPAYLRRYPFVLGTLTGKKDPVICIDMAYEGIGKAEGEPLFDSAGNPSSYLQGQMELAADFEAQVRLTGSMIGLLEEYDLLKPVSVKVETSSGSLALNGLEVVDEDRLQGLEADQVQKLFEQGFLLALYAHLISQGNFKALPALIPAE